MSSVAFCKLQLSLGSTKQASSWLRFYTFNPWTQKEQKYQQASVVLQLLFIFCQEGMKHPTPACLKLLSIFLPLDKNIHQNESAVELCG